MTETTTTPDRAALDTMSSWYASLSGALHTHTAAVVTAAALGEVDECAEARDEMLTWSTEVLQAHLYASRESLLARAGQLTSAQLLVQALLSDQSQITSQTSALAEAPSLTHAAAQALGLQVLVDRYLGTESRQVLAALIDGGAALDEMVTRLESALASYVPVEPESGSGCGGNCGSCSCGG